MSDIAKMIAIAKRFGGSSGPSEVVILPETELFVSDASIGDEMTFYGLRNKYEVAPVVGGTYKLLFGGDEHTSKAVDSSAAMGEGAVAMGNTDLMGLADMGIVAPDPTAQYVFCAFPNGSTDDVEGTTYGLLVASGLSEHPILSIVQVGAASGGESAGGGVCVVNVSCETTDGETFTNVTKDKSYAEVKAAYDAGAFLHCRLGVVGQEDKMESPLFMTTAGAFAFGPTALPNILVLVNPDDTVTVVKD